MTYTDCMIDFETLATRPDAKILQFGWVFFNRHDRQFEHFGDQCTIYQGDQQDRIASPSTVDWWGTQDPQLFHRLTHGVTPLHKAVALFINHFETHANSDTLLWSNPGSFDIAILENLMLYTGLDAPYSHRSFSCFRTAMRFYPEVTRIKPTVKHDGLEDAIAQAKTLQCIFHAQRLLEAASNH